MDSLKILVRQRRALELCCKGLTIPQIAAQLTAEGYKVSQHTVWKDRLSKIAQDFTEELLRKQLADITKCPDNIGILWVCLKAKYPEFGVLSSVYGVTWIDWRIGSCFV